MTTDATAIPTSHIEHSEADACMEIFPLPTDENFLFSLLQDIFENHWDKIVFGSAVQGGIFEIRVADKPTRFNLLDGYLTVDFGLWHFHLCIGENRGTQENPISPALAQHRKTTRAELFRRLDEAGAAQSWGLRLFNGKDEQQMTIFLPSPFLSMDQKILRQPKWENLSLWDHIRKTYLGLDPDTVDRKSQGFKHG